MKNSIIIFFMLIGVNISAQIRSFDEIPTNILNQIDKMGVNDSLVLNNYESDYFNVVFKDSLSNFNFSKKKIGFIGGGISSKCHYFKEERERYYSGKTTISSHLYIFEGEQKVEVGGYDAVIVCWSKFVYPKEEIIKKINKRQNKLKKK